LKVDTLYPVVLQADGFYCHVPQVTQDLGPSRMVLGESFRDLMLLSFTYQ
jgi:hypothetical protein